VAGLPELPAPYGDVLERGLADLELTLTPDARAAVDGQVRLLLAWMSSINLTAIRDPTAIALLHVMDSLSGVGLLRARAVDRFVDIGTGAGYPGLPLAAAILSSHALCIDPVGKKARFVEAVVRATRLDLRVEVQAVRAESLAADERHREAWGAVTARAVASLAELVELAFPLLMPGGVLLAWKRGDLESEIAVAERAVAAIGGGSIESHATPVRGLEGHEVVVVTKHGATPATYPRDPAARRRRPW
jgi:16S rRNA (guanine527-N7)-methyltransferase